MFHSGSLLNILRLVEVGPEAGQRTLCPHPLEGKIRSVGFKSLNLRLPPRDSLVLKRQPPHQELSSASDSPLALDCLTQ